MFLPGTKWRKAEKSCSAPIRGFKTKTDYKAGLPGIPINQMQEYSKPVQEFNTRNR
jgi:hypothetical protein